MLRAFTKQFLMHSISFNSSQTTPSPHLHLEKTQERINKRLPMYVANLLYVVEIDG